MPESHGSYPHPLRTDHRSQGLGMLAGQGDQLTQTFGDRSRLTLASSCSGEVREKRARARARRSGAPGPV